MSDHDHIELQVSDVLLNMGIAKIHRTLDSDDSPVLIIIPKDTTNYKSIVIDIDDTPKNTAYNCESACRDYLHLKIISAIQIFITDNWEQIKLTEEESSADGEGKKEKEREKLSYRARYTDRKNNILYESILVDGKPAWLVSRNGAVDVSSDPIFLDEKGKNRIEPIPEEEHLTKAYSFVSEDEVKTYVKLATATTLDDLYGSIKKAVKTYIDADDFHVSIVTVSIIFTYFQDRVGTTHYLFFVGPPNCGKTNNLTLFQEMGYRCMGSSGLSAADIYTFLGPYEPGMGTIAEDELDDIDDNGDKKKVYKNGTGTKKPYHRIDFINGERRLIKFHTFGFKAAAAERLPDPEKAGGLMQRIIPINCRSGHPEEDISEVVEPMGDSDLERLLQELNHIHKLLLVHRMIHFYKEFPDIQTSLENREKQLFKPLLRIFFGTKTQEDLRLILTNLVNKKRRENSSSLLAFLYQQIKELVERQKAIGMSKIPNPNVLSFSAIWTIMTNPEVNPGKENQHKSGYDSDEFGLFTKKEIGTSIRSLGGTLPDKKGGTRQYKFTDETLSHLAALYGQDSDVIIELKRKIRPKPVSRPRQGIGKSSSDDCDDCDDSGKVGDDVK